MIISPWHPYFQLIHLERQMFLRIYFYKVKLLLLINSSAISMKILMSPCETGWGLCSRQFSINSHSVLSDLFSNQCCCCIYFPEETLQKRMEQVDFWYEVRSMSVKYWILWTALWNSASYGHKHDTLNWNGRSHTLNKELSTFFFRGKMRFHLTRNIRIRIKCKVHLGIIHTRGRFSLWFPP